MPRKAQQQQAKGDGGVWWRGDNGMLWYAPQLLFLIHPPADKQRKGGGTEQGAGAPAFPVVQ